MEIGGSMDRKTAGCCRGAPADSEEPKRIEARTSEGRAYPLSFQQESLWFLQQLDPTDCSYNESKVLRLRGMLDTAALERAFRDLIDCHRILRTIYIREGETPRQFVLDYADFTLGIDRREGAPYLRLENALERVRIRALQSFDLATDLPIRAGLYAIAPDEHVLHIVVHHIAIDGLSWPLLLNDLLCRYAASAGRGGRFGPEQPALQYADYAVWQRETVTTETLRPALEFWSRKLEGVESLVLPTERTRPADSSHSGGVCAFSLPPDLVARCRSLARAERTTPFVVLLGAFKLLMARLSGQEDIVVGIPVANRTEEQLEPLIGFFINTVAARSSLCGVRTFTDLLAGVRSGWLDSLEHQHMPFGELVAALQPDRQSRRNPIFQCFFSFLRTPAVVGDGHGLDIEILKADFDQARFDIEISLEEDGNGIDGTLIYDSRLFTPETAARIASRYVLLLDAATADPDASVWHLPILAPDERRTLVEEWNRTAVAHGGQTLCEKFEEQVRRSPEAIAVRHGSRGFDYACLNARADAIARRLRRESIGLEAPVALHMERSVEYVAACLGVLKAGGTLVPLDTALPPARRSFILNDCGSRAIIATGIPDDLTLPEGTLVIDPREEALTAGTETPEDTAAPVSPDDAAYILYTSGSTGTPKGVVGLHRGLLNRLRWMEEAFPFDPGDVCATRTPIGFVDSITEILGPLLSGAALVILDTDEVRDTRELAKALRRTAATRVLLVPSQLRSLLGTGIDISAVLPSLSFWTCSGEALSSDLAELFHRLLPGRTLLNLYGSTEVSGDATAGEVRAGDDAATIGRPIANVQCYILDARGEPVPMGVAGELHVGGDGLARGYHGDAELTKSRFVRDPFDESPGARLFRTGDRARFLAEGRIEYLGRNDNQVKLRGVRVELGEVEAALRSIDSVSDAVVTPVPDAVTPNHLLAHVRPQASHPDPGWTRHLKAELESRLPPAYVPARFVEVDDFPRTASGKIDRLSLSAGDASPAADGGETAASPGIETRMLEIWREVLADDRIGAGHNFFEIGGHSLLAVKLVSRIEQAFDTPLPLSALFEAPTVARLTARIERSFGEPSPIDGTAEDVATRGQAAPVSDLVVQRHQALSQAWRGERPSADSIVVGRNVRGGQEPIFWVFQGEREVDALADALGPDQPLYGMRSLVGLVPIESYPMYCSPIGQRLYFESVDLVRGREFLLGGNCQGAIIALDLARRWAEAGQPPRMLVLMEWSFSYGAYDGPTLLLYGRDSFTAPLFRNPDPSIAWRRDFPRARTAELPAGHGQFFTDRNVGALAQNLARGVPAMSREGEGRSPA